MIFLKKMIKDHLLTVMLRFAIDAFVSKLFPSLKITFMSSPLSLKKTIKVLLLDPLPSGTVNAFSSPFYTVDSCFDDLTEAELVKKVQEYNVVCLRFVDI